MPDYDHAAFNEKILKHYATELRQRLPGVKFMLDPGDALGSAIGNILHPVGETGKISLRVSLDDHRNPDGSVREDTLVEAIAMGLSEPLIRAAKDALPPDDDPIKRIGAGQLYMVHKKISPPLAIGALVHFAEADGIGLFAQAWHENLKTMFDARTEWQLLRSGKALSQV